MPKNVNTLSVAELPIQMVVPYTHQVIYPQTLHYAQKPFHKLGITELILQMKTLRQREALNHSFKVMSTRD